MGDREVEMVADKDHIGFNYSGKAYVKVVEGESFLCSEGRALRLVEHGFAHLVLGDDSNEADEQPEPIPVVAPVAKVGKRKKAGKAAKGR